MVYQVLLRQIVAGLKSSSREVSELESSLSPSSEGFSISILSSGGFLLPFPPFLPPPPPPPVPFQVESACLFGVY